VKHPHVILDNVSLRFRKYTGMSNGLKEAAMRLVTPPGWYAKRPPSKEEFWGLRDVSLTLKEGDRIGIIGPNGAGKSSLLKVISRIYRPTLGTLSVEGRIAPLIEIGAGFIPELSGRDNAYLYGAILGLDRKTIRERLEAIVAFSGMEEFIDMPVKYFSTGMHLRLAFTIATEVAPDVLILDELYAGGDAAFIVKANSRLDKFVDRSRILILVAHQMEYISRFCNRALVLSKGRVVLDGSPAEAIEFYESLSRGSAQAEENLTGA
jgi:ABC-type polysaccharide/polyol phosphate transport system ATPase subunit